MKDAIKKLLDVNGITNVTLAELRIFLERQKFKFSPKDPQLGRVLKQLGWTTVRRRCEPGRVRRYYAPGIMWWK